MKKIDFVNNQAPYIDDDNLNLMQNNIEDAINEVVESGENENGSWTKWADGTMIVTQKKVATAVIEIADGNLFRGNVGAIPDFPVEFKEPPFINLTLTNAFKLILSGQEGSATTKRAFEINGAVPNIGVHSATSRTVEGVIINVTAIGKWK